VFDLGGGVTVEAVHLPGHTRGHSGFRIDGVFFLSDIDLTGFGPYYGDVWSDLEDFEASLAKVRDEEADFYVTFHHKGVIEGRETFVEMVDAFTAVIGRRHDAMLEFLREPHTLDEMREHRFIYRPTSRWPSSSRSSAAAPSCTWPACSAAAKPSRSNPAGTGRVSSCPSGSGPDGQVLGRARGRVRTGRVDRMRG
jgi:hypothetical protein